MPATSKKNEISDGYWLRKHAVQNGLPADCVRPYTFLLNEGIGYFKGIVDDIIKNGGGMVTTPMQPQYLEQYFTGYTFEYRTFCNLYEFNRQTEGYWQIDPNDPSHIIIFYNRCATRKRQRYSQVHELMHFAQTVDPQFLDFFDELILNSTLPENVVVKLLERLTDKAAAMYLMPNDFFIKKYEEIKAQSPIFGEAQVRQLATAFDVSVQTATYRLQECLGITAPYSTLGTMPP
jgi:hypothetical protein